MNVQPANFNVTPTAPEPPRPAVQRDTAETARPVGAPTRSEAATQQASNQKQTEERRIDNRRRETSVTGDKDLSQEEQQKLEELKQRDREVRDHEQAHLAAAGPYARSGARFEYETGPDNQRYAVGGEVEIDTGEEKDPEATIQKARTVRTAALAPQDPSPKDRQVAAEARQMEMRAQQEIAEQRDPRAETRKADIRNAVRGIAPPEPGRPEGVGSLVDLYA